MEQEEKVEEVVEVLSQVYTLEQAYSLALSDNSDGDCIELF